MANVLIEENTLKAIGNAIRAKTGKTDLILPKDMASEIGGITGGSGDSSDLVKYVTFMSEDGTTELFKMPVLSGDDCKDAVEHGDIDAPTKESTTTTNYTYNGWSLVSGGVADSAALQNVTEDRTVYASYAESVRYYTVNFYTEVGALYETVYVTYGGTATPTVEPSKSGYSFDGWSPSNENITVNMDCYAVWIEAITFAGGSWEDIARVCEAGEASKYFSIGDVREVEWITQANTTIKTQFQIIGIDHDDLSDSSGKAGITVASVPVINKTAFVFSSSYGTPNKNTCWKDCSARSVLNENVYNGLPEELKVHIKEVKKISNGTPANGNTLEETNDKVWILSLTELGKDVAANYVSGQGVPYEFLANSLVNRRKYSQNADGTITSETEAYFTRSSSSYSIGVSYCMVTSEGVPVQTNAIMASELNYPICFCI